MGRNKRKWKLKHELGDWAEAIARRIRTMQRRIEQRLIKLRKRWRDDDKTSIAVWAIPFLEQKDSMLKDDQDFAWGTTEVENAQSVQGQAGAPREAIEAAAVEAVTDVEVASSAETLVLGGLAVVEPEAAQVEPRWKQYHCAAPPDAQEQQQERFLEYEFGFDEVQSVAWRLPHTAVSQKHIEFGLVKAPSAFQ